MPRIILDMSLHINSVNREQSWYLALDKTMDKMGKPRVLFAQLQIVIALFWSLEGKNTRDHEETR